MPSSLEIARDSTVKAAGQLVKWRGPAGAMTEELESALIAHDKDVEAYLRWEDDQNCPQIPLEDVLQDVVAG